MVAIQSKNDRSNRVKEPRIQSLQRADAILAAVSKAGRLGIRLNELAATVNLNKTTVFNLVGSLVVLGYVRQDDLSRTYKLGTRTLQLGLRAQRQSSLIETCRVPLERLCRDVGETANLAVPLTEKALVVDTCEAGDQVRISPYVGSVVPYHASACGKAIFAFFDQARRTALYDRGPLARFGPNTIADESALEAELASIRTLRRAYDFEENDPGTHCVAVPIFDTAGIVCGAISLSGLSDRLDKPRLDQIADHIQRKVNLVENQLRNHLE